MAVQEAATSCLVVTSANIWSTRDLPLSSHLHHPLNHFASFRSSSHSCSQFGAGRLSFIRSSAQASCTNGQRDIDHRGVDRCSQHGAAYLTISFAFHCYSHSALAKQKIFSSLFHSQNHDVHHDTPQRLLFEVQDCILEVSFCSCSSVPLTVPALTNRIRTLFGLL